MPVYNAAAYLPAALRSVLGQTLRELELIAIDDGSTDASLEILQGVKDARVRIISRENRGVGPTRNEGIAAATGEYIFFLDPDDRIATPEVLELLCNKAEGHGVSICGGSLCRIYGEQVDASVLPGLEKQHFAQEGLVRYADYQYEYGFYRFIYRRSLLLENSIIFPSYPRFQDPPFMVRAMLCAGRFYAIPETTYAYRRSHKQIAWDRSRVDGFMAGVNDVWQLANEHQLSKLKRYLRWHIAEHYPEVVHLLTPAHLNLLEQIDEDSRLESMTLWRSFFSKHKHFANRKCRKFTVFGSTFSVYKK